MMLPIIVSPNANQDIDEAADWHQKQSRSGTKFVMRVQKVFDQISLMPELHAIVYRDLRRARMPKSSYNIYYRVLADHVEIMAVVHGHRDPSVWQSRV